MRSIFLDHGSSQFRHIAARLSHVTPYACQDFPIDGGHYELGLNAHNPMTVTGFEGLFDTIESEA